MKAQLGQIYKKNFVDVIEMACYANLGLFSTIIVNIATHISGVFTVLLIVIIISYHSMDIMLNSKCSKRYRYTNLTENQIQRSDNSSDTRVRDSVSKENYPTYSVVDLGQPADCGRQSSAKNLIVVISEYDQALIYKSS